ncbi:Malate dehydrogenase cytoplasmic [Bienertia sinuspersici]
MLNIFPIVEALNGVKMELVDATFPLLKNWCCCYNSCCRGMKRCKCCYHGWSFPKDGRHGEEGCDGKECLNLEVSSIYS